MENEIYIPTSQPKKRGRPLGSGRKKLDGQTESQQVQGQSLDPSIQQQQQQQQQQIDETRSSSDLVQAQKAKVGTRGRKPKNGNGKPIPDLHLNATTQKVPGLSDPYSLNFEYLHQKPNQLHGWKEKLLDDENENGSDPGGVKAETEKNTFSADPSSIHDPRYTYIENPSEMPSFVSNHPEIASAVIAIRPLVEMMCESVVETRRFYTSHKDAGARKVKLELEARFGRFFTPKPERNIGSMGSRNNNIHGKNSKPAREKFLPGVPSELHNAIVQMLSRGEDWNLFDPEWVEMQDYFFNLSDGQTARTTVRFFYNPQAVKTKSSLNFLNDCGADTEFSQVNHTHNNTNIKIDEKSNSVCETVQRASNCFPDGNRNEKVDASRPANNVAILYGLETLHTDFADENDGYDQEPQENQEQSQQQQPKPNPNPDRETTPKVSFEQHNEPYGNTTEKSTVGKPRSILEMEQLIREQIEKKMKNKQHVIHIETIIKDKKGHVDLRAVGPVASSVPDVRVGFAHEIDLDPDEIPSVVDPIFVRIKQRKSFMYKSWRYDLTRAWEGKTLAEASQKQSQGIPPVYEVELELLDPDLYINNNPDITAVYIATSLLLKLYDMIKVINEVVEYKEMQREQEAQQRKKDPIPAKRNWWDMDDDVSDQQDYNGYNGYNGHSHSVPSRVPFQWVSCSAPH